MSTRQETVKKLTQSNAEVSAPAVLEESFDDSDNYVAELNAAKLPICHAQYTGGKPVIKKLSWNEEKQQLNPAEQHASVIDKTIQNIEDTLYDLRDKFMDTKNSDYCLSNGTAHNTEEYSLEKGIDRKLRIGERVKVKSKRSIENYDSKYIARTKDLIKYTSEPAFMLFDIDCLVESLEEVLEKLIDIDPQLRNCAKLIVHSSSSMLTCGDTQLKGPRFHIYVVINLGLDVQSYKENFIHQSWRKGYGYIKVSSSGSLLLRSFVDESVFDGERINYEMPPILDEHLARDVPEPQVIDGTWVTLANCETVSDEGEKTVAKLIEAAKTAPEVIKESREKRNNYVEKEVSKVHKKTNLPKAEAKQVVLRALNNAELESGFLITLYCGRVVPVEDIINNPEQYVEENCLDPIEPGYDGGRAVGHIFVNKDDSIVIHSFARGGRSFTLKRGRVSEKAHQSWVKDKYDTRELDASSLIGMCVDRAVTYSMTIPETEFMLSECVETLGIKSKKTEYKKSIHERVKNQRDMDAWERRESGRAELLTAFEDSTFKSAGLLDKIDTHLFPDIEVKKIGGVTVLMTGENLDHLLKSYGIKYKNDGIAKLVTVTFPNEDELDSIRGNDGNSATSKISILKSICCRNNTNDDLIGRMPALEAKYYSNPIQEYVDELPLWDEKTDYLRLIVEEYMGIHPDYTLFASCAVPVWFIQGVAAANAGKLAKELFERDPLRYLKEPLPKYEGVLVLQGGQGSSKTDFLTSLLPRKLRRYIKTGVTLDVTDTDSVKQAVSSFIVELGELDATFRAGDMARTKSFLSKMYDEIRLPYAASENNYPRQTIYCGSVNDEDFLVDSTGNRRFFTLKVGQLKMVPEHIIDGAWAQANYLYKSGSIWWLDKDQEKIQEALNNRHAMRNDYSDSIEYYFKPGKAHNDDSLFVCLKVLQEIACRGNVNAKRFGVALKAAGFDTVANPTTCVLSGESLRGRHVRLTEAGKERVRRMVNDHVLDRPRALTVLQELNKPCESVLDDNVIEMFGNDA